MRKIKWKMHIASQLTHSLTVGNNNTTPRITPFGPFIVPNMILHHLFYSSKEKNFCWPFKFFCFLHNTCTKSKRKSKKKLAAFLLCTPPC